ncbi:MAG: PrsW family intramembrane metalloprotease [Archaeoglobaceae archaeon]
MHTLALIFVLAYAPSIALLWYFYHKDKYEPEPRKYVILTFIYGAINSVVIAVFLEGLIFQAIPSTALTIAIVAALIEEPAKAFVVRVPYKAGQMDGIMDGVVYGAAAGLGFAATENLFYGMGFGAGITFVRALLTPIAHGVWTATVGVGFGLRAEKRSYSALPILLLIAIFLHFLWNYAASMAQQNESFISIQVLLILLNIYIVFYLMRRGLKEDKIRFG